MGFIHDGTPQSSIRRLSSSVGPVSTSGATRSSSEIARVTGAYSSSLARQSRVIEKAQVTKMKSATTASVGAHLAYGVDVVRRALVTRQRALLSGLLS